MTCMARYGEGHHYGTGVHYGAVEALNLPKRMAKVKLELATKSDDEVFSFATNHKTCMAKAEVLAVFANPMPDAAGYNADLAAYGELLSEIEQLEIFLNQKRAAKDAARGQVEANLTIRGNYVDLNSGGVESVVLSTGFPVQSAATPTTSMAIPQNVTAKMGRNPGEITVTGGGVPKTKLYIYECREHADGAIPGAWQQVKTSSKHTYTVPGLTSGKKYAFRMKVIGPNDLESPWSDEAVCMAP